MIIRVGDLFSMTKLKGRAVKNTHIESIDNLVNKCINDSLGG